MYKLNKKEAENMTEIETKVNVEVLLRDKKTGSYTKQQTAMTVKVIKELEEKERYELASLKAQKDIYKAFAPTKWAVEEIKFF